MGVQSMLPIISIVLVEKNEGTKRHSTWVVFFLGVGVDDEQLRQLKKQSQVKGQADFSSKTPHLILTLLPSDRVDNPAKRNRKKRAAAATDAATCSRYDCTPSTHTLQG